MFSKLWTGARWTEGGVYFPAGKYVLFSDIPNDRIMRYDETDGSVCVFRPPCGYTNGHTVDRQGRLVSCEHGGRRVSRTEHDGRITVIADSYQGKKLNSPNDVVVKSDGSIWFTDPPFGILSDYEGHKAEQENGNNVYRVDGTERRDQRSSPTTFIRPNGLAFSLDEKKLYIVDSRGRAHQGPAEAHPRVRCRRRTASSPAARNSPTARPAASTACASTPTAGCGPRPTTACTASTPTAR